MTTAGATGRRYRVDYGPIHPGRLEEMGVTAQYSANWSRGQVPWLKERVARFERRYFTYKSWTGRWEGDVFVVRNSRGAMVYRVWIRSAPATVMRPWPMHKHRAWLARQPRP